MSESPTSTPMPSVLETIEALRPSERRERVQALTKKELQDLADELSKKSEVPAVFRGAELKDTLEKRMREEGIHMEARDRRALLAGAVGPAMHEVAKAGIAGAKHVEAAEKRFAKAAQGNTLWMYVGGALLAFGAYIGLKKAAEWKEKFSAKGILGGGIEFAKNHPIMMTLLAALGLKKGFDGYEYLQDNAGPIVAKIAEKAKELGIPETDAAKSIADKMRAIAGKGVDLGLMATVKGLSLALGGKYDEETGVVTLGHDTLHAPVVVAWQAGVRRRVGDSMIRKTEFSRVGIETKLSGILRQADRAMADASVKHTGEVVQNRALAKRGMEILSKPMNSADRRELESILTALAPHINLEPSKVTTLSDVEAQKHFEDVQNNMRAMNEQEIRTFNQLKADMETKLLHAEENLKNKRYSGSAEAYKQSVIKEAQDTMKRYHDDLAAKKAAIGGEYERLFNAVGGHLDEHVHHRLDSATHGRGVTSGALENATTFAEKCGYKMTKVPGGKWVMRSIIGYSFMPLALEGLAALRPGEAGEQAKKAFVLDATDAGIGFVPVLGELNDFRAAIMGTDLNGRELDTWSRITAGAMGTLGTASIVAGFFTGGTTIVGFKALRGAMAARKAVKVARLAEAGVETVQVGTKMAKAAKTAAKSAEALEKMSEISKTQKMARSIANGVRNAQRGVQLVTYGQLAFSMGTGAMELYNSADGIIGNIQNKAVGAIDTAEKFVHEHNPIQSH